MTAARSGTLTRRHLLDYFLAGAKPRESWQVGMELEKMGRRVSDGRPVAYDGAQPAIRGILEAYCARRGGRPVQEADYLVGLDGPWGTLSLEPGGQVEWSSRPRPALPELRRDLREHLTALDDVGREVGVRWLDVAVEPELAVTDMIWMPKARYNIMRKFLGERGRLAHRMMTQTASIQCAFDYADAEDWKRKFRAAALLAPVATALFANSNRVDGADSGYRSYRAAIWRETDPDRCGLPPVVFDPGFDMERWLDHVMAVPTIFHHRARGLVPSDGIPFTELLERTGCDAIRREDWETHASTLFTDVRSYTYIEVRVADLLPDDLAFAVPEFWTGILYDDDSLAEAAEIGAAFDSHERWNVAMELAARSGLDGSAGGPDIRSCAERAVAAARRGLRRWSSGPRSDDETPTLDTLAERQELAC